MLCNSQKGKNFKVSVSNISFDNEYGKALWQADPLSWTQNFGYAGDPISGDYVGGIAYTPHRDGAAGDEVDGIAGDGTVANVWFDDAAGDDIAIRWTGNSAVARHEMRNFARGQGRQGFARRRTSVRRTRKPAV